MPRYTVSWKLGLEGSADLTGTFSGVIANSEPEACEEAKKQLESYHSEAFQKGYAIAELYVNHSYLVNTGSNPDKLDEDPTRDMLDNKKAACYYDRKEKIEEFKRGDYIFLYLSKVGIIAHGIACGKVEKQPYYGVPDCEYFMKLDYFKICSTPLPASEIRVILNYSVCFIPAVIFISDEDRDKLLAYV